MKPFILRFLILSSFFLAAPNPLVSVTAAESEASNEGSAANGGLLVTPKRLVFSERQRHAELTLMNRGTKRTTFRLDWIDIYMDSEGRLIALDADDEDTQSLQHMVRLSPRQVTVEAGERQTVRVFVRRPADLESGEYRSHLRLRALPTTDAGPTLDDFREQPEDAFSFRITALPAISLPVIVRQGELKTDIALDIEDLVESEDDLRVVSLRLERQGDRSIYGDLSAFWHSATGEQILVGRAKGVSVYTSIEDRSFDLALHLPEGQQWSSGTLRVDFESQPSLDGGGPKLTASRELVVP